MTAPTEPVAATMEVSDPDCLTRQPKVSVLMLAYNQAPYIAKAISSVLEQRARFPFELIIGDDASMDETRGIALEAQRAYPESVRVLFSEQNVGMHANHGRLVSAARGEFIAYCEGDDYWLDQGKLQRQIDYMDTHPECGLVHANYLNLISVGNTWRTRLAFRKAGQLRSRAGAIYADMLRANKIQTCTVLSRLEMIERYRCSGPGVGCYLVGDWPEFLYLAHESEVGFINEPLAAYRRTPGSVTNSGHAAKVELCLDSIRMINDFCDHFGDAKSVRESALEAQFRVLSALSFRAGDQARFHAAKDWLSINRLGGASTLKMRAMGMLIKRPKLTSMLTSAFLGMEAVTHRITFRKIPVANNEMHST